MLFCPTAGSTVVQAEASVLGDYALGVIYFCFKTKTIINSICDKWIFLLDESQILGLPALNMGVWMICKTGVMFCTTCFFANMGDSIQTEQSETRQNLVLKSTKKIGLLRPKRLSSLTGFCSHVLLDNPPVCQLHSWMNSFPQVDTEVSTFQHRNVTHNEQSSYNLYIVHQVNEKNNLNWQSVNTLR